MNYIDYEYLINLIKDIQLVKGIEFKSNNNTSTMSIKHSLISFYDDNYIKLVSKYPNNSYVFIDDELIFRTDFIIK